MFGKKRSLVVALGLALCLMAVHVPQAMAVVPSDSGKTEIMPWKFKGNHTNNYSAGDTLDLTFEVVDVEVWGDYTFESLNYFEEVYALEDGDDMPSLNNYLS